jgi:hypothetical protein
MKKFNEYKGLNLPALSKEVLERWEAENLFEKSVTTREGHPQFLFFEGPPSANGKPGIHHVMARTIKDTFCRFKTMQGFQVRRKAGWDTHGLPVELGVEKMLGITKEDIGTLYARLRCLVDGDYLVLAGHIPDFLPPTMYEQVLQFLNGRNLNVVVDAEKELLTGTLKYHPWLIKPNRDELGDIFGVKIESRRQAIPYARKLQEMGARNVLVSMGKDGAVLLSEDGTIYSADGLKGNVVSTVGAGDSMVAGFIAGFLGSDGNVETAFRQGMCAGAASSFSLVIPDARQVAYMMRTSRFDITILQP